jgi:hypothetical protein
MKTETRPQVLGNPLFVDLKKIGAKPEEQLYVWSQGLAFHHANLLAALEKHVPDRGTRERILRDVWVHFESIGLDRVNKALGVTAKPNLAVIDRNFAAMLASKDHPAILGAGEYLEEALVNWVRAFAVYDWSIWTFMEKWLGSKLAMTIYMGLWEAFSLAELDHWKSAVGIKEGVAPTMKQLGALSRKYWESIGCPYKVTKDTEDVHEAEIEDCPYWQNMVALFGEEKARSMTLKTEAVVSVNYYDAVLRAMGIFDRVAFTMDKFKCCGDGCCRIRFQRRK